MPTSSDRFRVPAKPRLPSEMLVHVRRGNSLRELSAMKEQALAKLNAPDVKLKRFRAGDELMKFLQGL